MFLTKTCRLLADEHSPSFFGIKKNVKCRCIDEKEKKSKCPKKNFQSVGKEKKCVSVKFRVFGKKIEVFWVG
jgi:hypothetical protein